MSTTKRTCEGCGKVMWWASRGGWRGPSGCPHCGAVLVSMEVKIDPKDVAPMITAEREAIGELRADETIKTGCPIPITSARRWRAMPWSHVQYPDVVGMAKIGEPISLDETIQDCPKGYVHHVGEICMKCGRTGEPLEPL